MKDTMKMVVEQFFMITFAVLLGTSSLFIIDDVDSIPLYYPFEVIGIGVVTSLLSFLFYFKKEPTRKEFIIRVIVHFILLVTVVIVSGYFLDFYDDLKGALIVFAIIIFVYAFVWIATALMNKKTSDNINEALKRYNNQEK